MAVPLLDLKAQLGPLRSEILAVLEEVLDSTQYIGGELVERLESEVACYSGARFGVGVSSGTDALLVALMALGVSHGDIVLTTPYSFFATAGVITRLGATPAFVDIEPESFNLDPEQLGRWLKQHAAERARVKAIIPVHLYGQSARMEPIMTLSRRYDIPVVEDAAQAIGAVCSPELTSSLDLQSNAKVGSFGALGCFSFFPSKNLGGIGDGGMIVGSDEQLMKKVALLRNHGAHPKYYHSLIGGNFRLDPIQAAVLLVKLPHLETWHRMRQENAHYYDENLSIPGVVKPTPVFGRQNHVYNQYVVLVPERRDELRIFLTERNIGHEVYYPVPFHLQECFRFLGYGPGDFPIAEYAAKHSLALPIYPELSREMQDEVILALRDFYS